MHPSEIQNLDRVYKITCQNGCCCIIYNAAAIGNPANHISGKWYVRPYPMSFSIGDQAVEPFDSAEEAERAIRARSLR